MTDLKEQIANLMVKEPSDYTFQIADQILALIAERVRGKENPWRNAGLNAQGNLNLASGFEYCRRSLLAELEVKVKEKLPNNVTKGRPFTIRI
jgi:hypothetical protein